MRAIKRGMHLNRGHIIEATIIYWYIYDMATSESYCTRSWLNLQNYYLVAMLNWHYNHFVFTAPLATHDVAMICVNPLPAKLSYLNFHQLKVVSRYRDPQLQVGEINHICFI